LVPTEIEAITPRVSAEDVWTPVPLIPEDSEEMEEQLLQRIALRLITKMAR
jgi:hypothetical protein